MTKVCYSLDNETSFPASSIAYCYCLDHLKYLLSGDFSTVYQNIQNAGLDDNCYPFILQYGSAISITYVAVFCIVIINRIIKFQIKWFTSRQIFDSLPLQQSSLLFKLFGACYINMTLVILIAYARIEGVINYYFLFSFHS